MYYLNGPLRKDYGQLNHPTGRPICNLVQKFDETGSIGDRVSRVHSAENVAAVRDSVPENPELLIRRRSHSMDLSYGSL